MEAMAHPNWTDDRIEERFDRVEGQISDLRIEMRTEIKDLRDEVKAQGSELRAEIAGGDASLRQEIAGVEARIRSQANEHYARTGEEFARVHGDSTGCTRAWANCAPRCSPCTRP